MCGVSLSPGLWGNNLEQSCFRFSTLFRLTLRKAVFKHLFHPQEGILTFFSASWKFFICDRQNVSQLFFWETRKYPVHCAKMKSSVLQVHPTTESSFGVVTHNTFGNILYVDSNIALSNLYLSCSPNCSFSQDNSPASIDHRNPVCEVRISHPGCLGLA